MHWSKLAMTILDLELCKFTANIFGSNNALNLAKINFFC